MGRGCDCTYTVHRGKHPVLLFALHGVCVLASFRLVRRLPSEGCRPFDLHLGGVQRLSVSLFFSFHAVHPCPLHTQPLTLMGLALGNGVLSVCDDAQLHRKSVSPWGVGDPAIILSCYPLYLAKNTKCPVPCPIPLARNVHQKWSRMPESRILFQVGPVTLLPVYLSTASPRRPRRYKRSFPAIRCNTFRSWRTNLEASARPQIHVYHWTVRHFSRSFFDSVW